MVALQIQDIKQFMNKLLLTPAFDSFLLVEGTITTYNTFHISGRLQKSFFSEEELEAQELNDRDFSLWKELRPVCLDLIKGRKTPLGFQFIFQLSRKNTQKLLASSGITSILPENVSGLLLNIRFEHSSLCVVTATNLNLFTLEKSLDHAWDDLVKRFLKQQEISFI